MFAHPHEIEKCDQLFLFEMESAVEQHLLQGIDLVLVDRLDIPLALVDEEVFEDTISTHTDGAHEVAVFLSFAR